MAPEESGDSIEKLFDDADQEHVVEKSDDVLEETIAKDASKVVAEKARKKRKRKVVRDASGSTYPPKKLRDDHQSLLFNTSGKSLAALRGMVPNGYAIPSGATEPLIAAFVAPVSDAGPLDSVLGPNFRTLTVSITTTVDADVADGSKDKVVSKYFKNIGDSTSAGGVNTDAAIISRLKKTSTSSDSFHASESFDTKTMHCVYIPTWKVTNDSTLDDPYVCCDLMDHLAPPALFAQLRPCIMISFILNSMLVLHDKFVLGRSQLSIMETADATKSIKLRDLKEDNFALKGEISALSERATTLESVTTSKEAELASLSFQVTKLTAGIQDGLKVGIDHGKVSRDLSVVEAYDPSAEEKYVDAVNTLGAVDFSLLSELESKKESSIVDLMDSLHLEGALAEIPKAEDILLSPEQLMLPIYRPEDNVVFAKTSLSFSLKIAPITTLLTTFASSAVIPPSLVVTDQVLDAETHSKDPPSITFKKEELSTSPE
uniref:Transposase (Putative), gypsy type n=1 Tax=Tanacetum cinerariifolium TaxID=118510 RepID=A0A6L2K3J9_TANCI|nr:hypothetical protein [Tanacetum cinerariifolium]